MCVYLPAELPKQNPLQPACSSAAASWGILYTRTSVIHRTGATVQVINTSFWPTSPGVIVICAMTMMEMVLLMIMMTILWSQAYTRNVWPLLCMSPLVVRRDVTKHRGWMVGIPASYSEYYGFDSQPRDRMCCFQILFHSLLGSSWEIICCTNVDYEQFRQSPYSIFSPTDIL